MSHRIGKNTKGTEILHKYELNSILQNNNTVEFASKVQIKVQNLQNRALHIEFISLKTGDEKYSREKKILEWPDQKEFSINKNFGLIMLSLFFKFKREIFLGPF